MAQQVFSSSKTAVAIGTPLGWHFISGKKLLWYAGVTFAVHMHTSLKMVVMILMRREKVEGNGFVSDVEMVLLPRRPMSDVEIV